MNELGLKVTNNNVTILYIHPAGIPINSSYHTVFADVVS